MAPSTVYVKQTGPAGKLEVQVELESTVEELKDVLSAPSLADVPSERQRLIYKGQILRNERTLSSYGLEAGHTIHLVKGAAQGSQQPATARDTTVPNVQNQPSITPGLGTETGGGLGFQQFQQQMMQNPQMMSELMESPLMQSMMNNPELMRTIMMNNPQMRQIMERNPELAHIFNDPSVLRQTMEIARNPELLREQMRNTDRAMSNIEAHPEGFNMLRRMYENVQEPLMNASVAPEESENPFAGLFGSQASEVQGPVGSPNTSPLPNPWAVPGSQGTQQPTTNIASGTPAGTRASNVGMGDPTGLGMTPEQMQAMMQSPMMQQMLQSLSSNPQLFEAMLNSNPQTRAMLESNPEMRTLLANPEFLRVMMDPGNMQAMMQMEQAMNQLRGGGLGSVLGGETAASPNMPGNGSTNAPDLNSLLGLLGAAGTAPPPENPESAYSTQLQQLKDMGFYDVQENIRALVAARGNVNEAIERLLSSRY